IQAYGKWLAYYRYSQQMAQYGITVGSQPLGRQAAVLQAMQFAPNGTRWKIAFARGDYSVPSTSSRQARFLGDTSIHDMEAYYTAFFQQHPPSYAPAAQPAPAVFAARNLEAEGLNIGGADFARVAGLATGDGQFIPALLKIASDADQLDAAQTVAAKRLL